MNVGLLDYGAGNLHSLVKAVERFGAATVVSDDWSVLLRADAIVLPGVGAFGAAVRALPADVGPVRETLEEGLPCLGICLGMQLLFESSEEAGGRGIGLIEGEVRRLMAKTVPHIGWNDVEVAESQTDDPVVGPAYSGFVGYFANSFVCHPSDEDCVVAWSEVEGTRFASAVRRGRAWGVQFHPEKSSQPGLAMIGRFLSEASPAKERT